MKLRFTERANREFAEAADYLVTDSPPAARLFADTLENVLALIRENPKIGRITVAGVRVFVLTRFPYKIFCDIDGATITVLSIFHAARNPEDDTLGH